VQALQSGNEQHALTVSDFMMMSLPMFGRLMDTPWSRHPDVRQVGLNQDELVATIRQHSLMSRSEIGSAAVHRLSAVVALTIRRGMPGAGHRAAAMVEGSRSSRALCTAYCEDVHVLGQEDRILYQRECHTAVKARNSRWTLDRLSSRYGMYLDNLSHVN
jgi:hypothetical protein